MPNFSSHSVSVGDFPRDVSKCFNFLGAVLTKLEHMYNVIQQGHEVAAVDRFWDDDTLGALELVEGLVIHQALNRIAEIKWWRWLLSNIFNGYNNSGVRYSKLENSGNRASSRSVRSAVCSTRTN